MPRWEYLEVMVYGGAGAQPDAIHVNGKQLQMQPTPSNKIDLCAYLNQLGWEGWEMVSHVVFSNRYHAYNFKRPIRIGESAQPSS